MTLIIEEETEVFFTFDYQTVAEEVIQAAIDAENFPFEAEISLLMVSVEEIQEINCAHRQIDAPTDVLSFPMIDYQIPSDFSHLEDDSEDYFNPETGELLLGDIVISVEKVIEQAQKYGHSRERELAFLVAHSMLHLFGYDHIKESEREKMEKKQEEILKILGIER